MAFGPFTLADFTFVSGGIFTGVAGGNPPTTPKAHDASFPVSTGNGDQNVNIHPSDTSQNVVSLCDDTSLRSTNVSQTTDILLRLKTFDAAGAGANGRVQFSVWQPPFNAFT